MALIFRCPFTENGIDTVNNITPTNNNLLTYSTENGAFFSRSAGLIYPGVSGITAITIHTISLWIKNYPDWETVSSNYALWIGTASSVSGGSYFWGLWPAMYTYMGIRMFPGNNDTSGTANNKYYSQILALSENRFKHYVFVVNTGTNGCKLYVDGVLVYQISQSVAVNASSYKNPVLIGRYNATHSFWGWMLDARIYNHVLNEREIQELYLAGPNGVINVSRPYSFVIGEA